MTHLSCDRHVSFVSEQSNVSTFEPHSCWKQTFLPRFRPAFRAAVRVPPPAPSHWCSHLDHGILWLCTRPQTSAQISKTKSCAALCFGRVMPCLKDPCRPQATMIRLVPIFGHTKAIAAPSWFMLHVHRFNTSKCPAQSIFFEEMRASCVRASLTGGGPGVRSE